MLVVPHEEVVRTIFLKKNMYHHPESTVMGINSINAIISNSFISADLYTCHDIRGHNNSTEIIHGHLYM